MRRNEIAQDATYEGVDGRRRTVWVMWEFDGSLEYYVHGKSGHQTEMTRVCSTAYFARWAKRRVEDPDAQP